MYLTWYPAFVLLYCPAILFVATWVAYIMYTVQSGSDHATRPPIRMLTEMFMDEPLASGLVMGVPTTMMSVGLFATGVLLDVVYIESKKTPKNNTGEKQGVRADTRIFSSGLHLSLALKLVSFLLVLSIWMVICTSERNEIVWHRATHGMSALMFMVSAAAVLWIAYKLASLLLSETHAAVDRAVAYAGEACCLAGIVTVMVGFDDWDNAALVIASGELVILGGLTISTLYFLARIAWSLGDVRLSHYTPAGDGIKGI